MHAEGVFYLIKKINTTPSAYFT